MTELIGKFHPLLLHLPIGVLVYCFIQLCYDTFFSKKEPVRLDLALLFGAGTAIFSAISGYILASSGEYEGDLLFWHKWLGIATAILSVVIYISYKKLSPKRFFFLFLGFMILLGVTGHYGGSITHGSDFLTISEDVVVERINEEDLLKSDVFQDLVMPIVKRKCLSCHNPTKAKGDLLMDTKEGWQKGGKEGNLVVAKSAKTSLLIERIHLPKEEKEHMPPAGKIQLEFPEIKLLTWWIDNMNNYTHTLEDLKPTEEIMQLLIEMYAEDPIDVEAADANTIQRLDNKGYQVHTIKPETPWLQASLSNFGPEVSSALSDLKSIKEQIQILELSGSAVTDADLNTINKFINLKVLKLDKTAVTTKGLKKLSKLKKLKILNIYSTSVDADALKLIKNFPALERLYIWQSKISPQEITDWKEKPENLLIDTGVDKTEFKITQVDAPVITAETEMFQDSLVVSLESDALKSTIYYTLDGSVPDTTKLVYQGPITITESAQFRTYQKMAGWLDSEVVSKFFFQNRFSNLNCKIDVKPGESYAGDGAKSLVDLSKGSEDFKDGKWLGFQQKHVTATIDFDSLTSISSVSVSALQEHNSYIFHPNAIEVSTSLDGKNYTKIAETKLVELDAPGELSINSFTISFAETETKFIRTKIFSRLKNPEWHSAPGAPCWLFIDELIVQ